MPLERGHEPFCGGVPLCDDPLLGVLYEPRGGGEQPLRGAWQHVSDDRVS